MPVVGRDSSADIVIPLPQVSARHALIEPTESGQYRVRDLSSANGTFVGRTRVTETTVDFGTDLRFGSVAFDWRANASRLNASAPSAEGFILGRDPGSDLVVSESRVSSRHLRVVPRGASLELFDLGSSNGLFVNGRRVSSAVVGPGDDIRLGSLPIDLFAIVATRWAIPAAPAASRAPAPPPTPPSALDPSAPIAVPAALAPAPGKALPRALWAAAAVLVLLLGAVGLAFGTQETVTKGCESCSKQVFSRKAFFWQRDAVAREAEAIRWCPACADEPVPYRIVLKCRLCGAPYGENQMTAPRREQPKDTERREGFCSPRCQNEQLARDAAAGVKKAADDLANGTKNLIQGLFKR